MDDQKFYVGDRVVCIADAPDHNADVSGLTGTVMYIDHDFDPPRVYVFWDRKIRKGHDLGGRCENGYGWKVWANEIQLIDNGDFNPSSEEDFAALLFG